MKEIISIVIPVFNEGRAIQHNLPVILSELEKNKNHQFQVLVVDDGSTDDTVEKVRESCEQFNEIELISLNRNFGKEAAVHAGLSYSRGEAVIVMDSDLQHPPRLISQMIRLWQEGVAVVEACKASRGKESFISKILAQGFYFLFNYLTKLDIKNKSDFKLLDRKVVEAYCSLPERKRFFRGMIPWMGFDSAQIFFDVPERLHGESSWPKLKLLGFSMTALSSFTSAPLHLVSLLSIIFFILSVALGIFSLYMKFSGMALSGFTTVILLILITGSLIMFALGQIGVYIEQIFDEIKQRPHYLINEKKTYLKKDFLPMKEEEINGEE